MPARHYVDPDPSWDWIDQLQVGDVIIIGKSMRVVRAVNKRRSGLVHCITVTILRCSWTKRCYTVMSRSDLKTRKAVKVEARAKMGRPIDEKVNEAIRTRSLDVKCFDVKGIV